MGVAAARPRHLGAFVMDNRFDSRQLFRLGGIDADDPRVRHIRHAQNIGHVRNYNAGLAHANGRYIWLISADDRLGRPYVLGRFVETLEAHRSATYVFCPAMRFDEDRDLGLYGSIAPVDVVLDGEQFVCDVLLQGNFVPAPAVMARRSAYEAAGGYPLDLPFANDWYMWAAFALQGQVAYLAEAMVGYRVHPLNITKTFLTRVRALAKGWR